MLTRMLTILTVISTVLTACAKFETWETDNNCSGNMLTDYKFCKTYTSRTTPPPRSGTATE